MQFLSKAYGARWSAAFGHRDLRYNDRLWKPIGEYHSPEDMFFGLIDPSDGSSWLIRIETLGDIEEIDDEDIEDSMAESIADARLQARLQDRWTREIGGRRFNFVEYAITNSKFGEQALCHAYFRGDGDLTLLVLSWPANLPRDGDRLPVKHLALLGGLSL